MPVCTSWQSLKRIRVLRIVATSLQGIFLTLTRKQWMEDELCNVKPPRHLCTVSDNEAKLVYMLLQPAAALQRS